MNEQTEMPPVLEGAAICRAASKTPRPCWRLAVERHFDDDEGPTLCTEHARLVRASEEKDAWWFTLCAIEEWVRGPVSEDPYGHLERLATNMRDEVRAEYAGAAAKAYAAELAARQGAPREGEPRLTLEQATELARLINRADAFANARTLVEDAPAEVLQRRDRWVTVNALAEAAESASEEAGRYKEELGLKD